MQACPYSLILGNALLAPGHADDKLIKRMDSGVATTSIRTLREATFAKKSRRSDSQRGWT